MPSESQPTLGTEFSSGEPLPPPEDTKKLLAPVWHTVLIVVLVLANSFFTAWITSHTSISTAKGISEKGRIAQYAFTILLELFLLLLVWIGLRLKRTSMREIIGGRWSTPEEFLMDVVIAFLFWIAAFAVLAGLGYLLGLVKPAQVEEAKKLASLLAPRSVAGLCMFILLSVVAGFVEEIIFRGYLQRQIGALAGNIWIGLVVSALIFGGGHGYEGTRRMVLIAVYGAMFGALALWRRSLRPGMMAHAWHDSFQGVLLFVATRKGLVPMH
jgi:membrane protease YdiL (CAAX protease family)